MIHILPMKLKTFKLELDLASGHIFSYASYKFPKTLFTCQRSAVCAKFVSHYLGSTPPRIEAALSVGEIPVSDAKCDAGWDHVDFHRFAIDVFNRRVIGVVGHGIVFERACMALTKAFGRRNCKQGEPFWIAFRAA